MNKDGILQYIPEGVIDYNKEIKIEDFTKFEYPRDRLIIVSETLYKIYEKMGIAKNFTTLRKDNRITR